MSQVFDRLQSELAGRYVLGRELGSGGMATVYLAEDVRHRRKVAVKVLRSDLSATLGPERFAREIEIAARLQHPHILPVLDSGDADGVLYYVMPYIEGEPLGRRLAQQGRLPIGETIRLLSEVADALAYAHAHGVVHRDIKPDNVMLSGRHVLVADFGVAKAVSQVSGAHPALTGAGFAVGTPTYMAPEQATGDPNIDHRADIYALGVLGYEMLTGEPPFSGTSRAVLAAHALEAAPSVSSRRPDAPAPLAELVDRCLAKEPNDRWQSAQEIVERLEAISTSTAPPPRAPRLARVAVVIVGAGILATLAMLALRRPDSGRLELGRATQVTFEPGLELDPALSPNGELIAYSKGPADRMRIFVRQVSGGQPIAVSTGSGAAPQRQPEWSPDGSSLLYESGDSVYLVPALGGVPRLVGPGINTRAGRGLRYFTTKSWAPDGKRFLFNRADSLLVQPIDGGSPTLLARLPIADPHSFTWSPDGRWIAFVTGNSIFNLAPSNLGNVGPSSIWIMRATGGEPRKITTGDALNLSPAWMPDSRHLLFVSNRDGPRDVYRVLLDRNGGVANPVERVTQGLNASSISLAANGRRLAYSTLTISANIWAAHVPPDGRPADPASVRALTVGSDLVESVSMSHDGRWLYFDSNLHGNQDIYRMPADGGAIEQLTTNPADDFNGEVSPDDKELAFHAVRNGTRDIVVIPSAGGAEKTVYGGPYEERWPHWSPDGRSLAFSITEAPGSKAGLYVIHRAPDGSWGEPRKVSPREVQGYWTRDGKALLLERGFADWENEQLVHYIERVWVDTGRTDSLPIPFENASFVGTRIGSGGRELFLRIATRGGSVAFWAMPVTGGKPRLILRPEGPDIGGRGYWATNGKRLYFVRTERKSDIFVAEVK
jgi:serine/threonine-protein kinase